MKKIANIAWYGLSTGFWFITAEWNRMLVNSALLEVLITVQCILWILVELFVKWILY